MSSFCCWNFVEKQWPGVSSWKIQTKSHVPKIWLSIPLHLFSKILESNNNTGLSDSLFLWFSWLVLQPSSIHLSWDGVLQQLKDSRFHLCYWFDFLVFLQIDSTRRSYQTQRGQRNPNRLNVQLEHLAFWLVVSTKKTFKAIRIFLAGKLLEVWLENFLEISWGPLSFWIVPGPLEFRYFVKRTLVLVVFWGVLPPPTSLKKPFWMSRQWTQKSTIWQKKTTGAAKK